MKKGLLLIILGMVITLSGCKEDEIVQGVVFNLEGDTQIDLFVDDAFVDAGFTATDAGVDISEYITITGTVDITAAGTYFIEYVLVYNEQTRVLLRTITVTTVPLTDIEISEVIFDDITVVAETLEDIDLDTYNTEYASTIVWSSDTEAIISAAGVVTRPDYGLGNATVIMTATVTVNSVDYTEEFTVVVLEGEEPYSGSGTEIFISEYVEGGSYNKAIELFNPTASSITLTGYTLNLYSNEATEASFTLDLDAYTIASGDVLVLYNSGSVTAISDVGDDSAGVVNWNGNDAIGLYKDDVLIDLFGIIGDNPEDFWVVGDATTKDYTLVRNSSVTGPVATWDPTEWTAFPKDTFTNLGSHETE